MSPAGTRTMKAVVVRAFGPPGTARVEDIPAPQPGPGEVAIRVAACPANYVDTVVMAGRYQFTPPLPFTPGKGPVGEVVSLGAGVTGLAPGDRVLAMCETGGYAQQAVAPAANVYPLPAGLDYADAAAMSLAFDTAWVTLHDRGRLAAGETVLVLGATGAVGYAAMQLARAAGARVIAAVSSAARTDEVLAAGADAVVDLSVEPLRDALRQQVHALTDGRGADVVVDPLGGDAFDAALRCVAWRGRLVVVGFAAGRIPVIKANYLMLKNIEVSGIQVSDYRKRMPDLMRRCFTEIFDLCVAGRITAPPHESRPLEDHAAALADILERRTRQRILLIP